MQYIRRLYRAGDTFSAQANGIIVSSYFVSEVKWTDTWKLLATQILFHKLDSYFISLLKRQGDNYKVMGVFRLIMKLVRCYTVWVEDIYWQY